MPANNTLMSLKTINPTPSTFQGSTYTYQPDDMSILQRSLELREARQQMATNQRAELDKTLGAIQTQLNSSEREYFEKYKDNIENDVNASIDIGDYGNAITKAVGYGASILKDVNITDRIKAQSEYSKRIEEEKQRIGKGVSSAKYDWWAEKNGYQFNVNKDANGKDSGGKLGDIGVLYDDIDYASWALAASQLYKPDEIASDNSGNNDERHWSSSNSFKQVTPENIKEVTENLFLARPEAREQFIQDYEFRRDQYLNRLNDSDSSEEAKEQLKKGIIKNGVIMPMEEFFQQQILLYTKALSYKESKTSSGGGTYKTGGGSSSGIITGADVPEGYGLNNHLVPGPSRQVTFEGISPTTLGYGASSYFSTVVSKSVNSNN